MRGYMEAYGMKDLQVIGLTPWALLANAECLRSDDFLGKTRFSLPQKTTSSQKGIQLAENHTHYILIDTPGKAMSDMIRFRANFEAWISRRPKLVTDEDQKDSNKFARSSTLDSATTYSITSEYQHITGKSVCCGLMCSKEPV
ncbi:unnamed protein product [Dibothriocephalus latus]|uniref:TRPM SLOG domain-containing protein n=1 Tax=Dibothriocephalus latus TaxID=60516 RepID=A0A3P6PT99_DIBLA|nr:unnamed protein product [Dibothriocephalus latus]